MEESENISTRKTPWFRSCLMVLLLFLAFTGLMSIVTPLVLGIVVYKGFSDKTPKNLDDLPVDEFPVLTEVWSYGDKFTDSGKCSKIVRVAINGEVSLSSHSWESEEGSAAFALEAIRAATTDPDVNGILLEIDSPGGGITDSDIIYNALMEFKASATGRKVVVMMGDMCASGGYYIAAAADVVAAHPTTITGSIGVMMSAYNFRQLADRIGVKDVSVTSGENKNMLSPFHDLTEEQQAMLKGSIDEMYERFVSIVAEGRGLDVAEVKKFADGRIFTATEAQKLGLVDQIGYVQGAMDTIAAMLEYDEACFIRYERELTFKDLLHAKSILRLASQAKNLVKGETPRLKYSAF